MKADASCPSRRAIGQHPIDGIVSFEPDDKPVLGAEYIVTLRLINPESLGGALKKDAVFDFPIVMETIWNMCDIVSITIGKPNLKEDR